ncbi:MAG: ANTAR domain-containing protein [Rhodospirillales bacterium]|jgi:AmiR/NasT family two-component response regulator|nr:ANTAR domain-containing protein [Rhodospirillales bacterium]
MTTQKHQRNESMQLSSLVRNLKSVRVLLIQPRDEESENLYRHLTRIGCRVQTSWPPPEINDADFDVVCVALRPIMEREASLVWDSSKPPAALVAVIDYENPVIVQAAVELNAHAVIGLPLRNFGTLANLFIALKNFRNDKDQRDQIEKLKRRLSGMRAVSNAKEILMKNKGVSESKAYSMIRDQAMNKRMSVQDVALAIINANEIFQ